MRSAALCLSVVLAASSARAQGAPAPTQPAPAPPAPTQPAPAPARLAAPDEATSGGDDFDLLPPEKVPDAAMVARQQQITRDLGRRRTLLEAHQLAGFATLASMTVTVVLGQLNYLDKYAGGGDTERWIKPHEVAAFTTTGVFAAAGLLALFAPSPTEKPLRLDTATVHKIAMATATAGMLAQVALGILAASKEGSGSLAQRDLALAHQIIGYATLGATATGFLALTF